MKTDFDTLRDLASYTIDLLKGNGVIEFDIENRSSLIEGMATEYGVSLSTDEDIRDQAIEEVEEKMGIDPSIENILETEMFGYARKEIIKSFHGENISGLYLVESLHDISHRMSKFLLNCDDIEDVFGSDEDIHTFLVKKIRQFSIKKN